MGSFVLRRTVHGVLVVLGVTVTVFVVTRLIGDPVDLMLPLEATPEQREVFAANFGLDRPIPIQFVDYVRGLSHFDFGESLWQRRPARDIVFEHLPLTIQLVFPAMALAATLGIPLGIVASLRPGRVLDRSAVTLSLIGLSVPQFGLGLLLILLFAVNLNFLPSSGAGSWKHAILPVITLALPAAGRLTILVRSSMMEELNRQYVHMAKAKALPFAHIVVVHAFRNASIPALTLLGWELIRALAGFSIIVETVFSWPGLGFITAQAIDRGDLILLQAIVLFVSVLVVFINSLIDIFYHSIDPRIRVA